MGEVMRFRIARAPQRSIPDPDLLVNAERILPGDKYHAGKVDRSPFVKKLIAQKPRRSLAGRQAAQAFASTNVSKAQINFAQNFADSEEFVSTGTELETKIKALDLWLVSKSDRPTADDLLAQLNGLKLKTDTVTWWKDRTRLSDSLIASFFADVEPGIRGNLSRLMLLFGLLEALQRGADLKEDGVRRFLTGATVILPEELARSARASSILARRPGFSDLYVVKEEWNRFELGEVAYVENVLLGELKDRTHVRTTENETTLTEQTSATRSEERDTQTTDRFELSQQSQDASSLAAHIEGQVDTSGQYGITSVDTHLGGSLDASLQHSENRASKIAKETVSRAAVKIEQSVLSSRTDRSLTRIQETNRHTLDNQKGKEHLNGMYRWLQKVQRLQVFRYSNRFLLEFQVPEPASYVRWLNKQPPVGGILKEPKPFVIGGRAATPDDMTTDKYQGWIAEYGVQGVEPPPQPEKNVNASLQLAPDKNYTDETDIDVVSSASAEGGVQIPDGYAATSVYACTFGFAVNDDIKLKSTPVIYLQAAHKWTHILTSVPNVKKFDQFGGDHMMAWGAGDGTIAFPKPLEGHIPVSVLAVWTKSFSVNLTFNCQPTDDKMAAWRKKTYEAILSAYQTQKRQYDEERASLSVQRGVTISGPSPERNQEIAREELKKKTIEMLLGSTFDGRKAIKPEDGDKPPVTMLEAAASVSPEIQFLEQAFEWENMTYVLYPYYWADGTRWPTLAPLESNDPEYARFLRSGSARVIVPARPGFERQVQLYTEYGILWGGGSVPAPAEEGYLSVADEIRSQQQAPADGVAGESWEVRLPTTMLWIENEPVIPLVNKYAELDAPLVP